jgi:polyprenyldihydroxybenzoate methyltransferase/3-demethylubiquinol 3-O-methyltransferase
VFDGGPRACRQPSWISFLMRRTSQGMSKIHTYFIKLITYEQPGGHLFLSTIARTPLSYVLTILVAEQILGRVTPGTHSHPKYINPSELISFFHKYQSPCPQSQSTLPSKELDKPWITRTYEHGLPTRTEAEVRGMIYIPWKGKWTLTPRGANGWGATDCNYLFWVRRPRNA